MLECFVGPETAAAVRTASPDVDACVDAGEDVGVVGELLGGEIGGEGKEVLG